MKKYLFILGFTLLFSSCTGNSNKQENLEKDLINLYINQIYKEDVIKIDTVNVIGDIVIYDVTKITNGIENNTYVKTFSIDDTLFIEDIKYNKQLIRVLVTPANKELKILDTIFEETVVDIE